MHSRSVHSIGKFSLATLLAATFSALAACEGSAPVGLTDDIGGAAHFDRAVSTSVCHRKGNGEFQSIAVAPSAVQSHLAHGDRTFDGTYDFFGTPATTVVTNGSTFNGSFLETFDDRPDFGGPITDGCTATVTFPDDATYQATMVSACKLQWSYANSTIVNPYNYWIKENCVE